MRLVHLLTLTLKFSGFSGRFRQSLRIGAVVNESVRNP